MASAAAASFLHNAAGALWTPQVKATAEASSIAAPGAAMFLWSWNRSYYSFDMKQRWARFNFINKMACSQTSQYREDIEDLANLTVNRADNWHIIGVMALTIATALLCPGRLGLHTPPPPSWLMALFHTNLAGSYMWLFLTMWLAMHASLRADSAAAHMLTRMVRVPVPSQRQMDAARRLFSTYEYQPVKELLRVPFFMGHARKGQGDPQKEGKRWNNELAPDAEAASRARMDMDVPAWFQNERRVDEARPVESMMPACGRGDRECPQHFEVFRVIQCQFWPYDVYARICIFLQWMHLTSAWTYYQLGHTMMETRAPWAAFAVVIPLFVTQHCVLTLDLMTTKDSIVPWQRFGPFGFLTAYVATCLEYKRWYSSSGLYVSAFLVFATYICVMIYTVALLRLCAPDDTSIPEANEAKPGAQWWPKHWRLPSSWVHAVWLVAPPMKLAAGEHDLTAELRRSSYERTGETEAPTVGVDEQEDIQNDVHEALRWNQESPAWFYVRTGLQGLLVMWIFLTIGYFVDIINEGTVHPSLLSAPGLPNHLRDPRYRPPKPGYECTPGPEDANGNKLCLGQEVGPGGYYAGAVNEQVNKAIEASAHTGGHHGTAGGHHGAAVHHGGRLLAGTSESRQMLSDSIEDLVPYLKDLIHDRDDSRTPAFGIKRPPAIRDSVAPTSITAKVSWPTFFEPRFLVCNPNAHDDVVHTTLAISRYGRAFAVHAKTADTAAETVPVALEGAAHSGPFLAAHWGKSGFLLATSSGGLLECLESPFGGRICNKLNVEALPLDMDSFEGSLAVKRQHVKGLSELLVAVATPGDLSVAFFRLVESQRQAQWLPAGEARTPSQVAAVAFTEDTLQMLLVDGSVARMRLSDGVMAAVASAVDGPLHSWQSTCSSADDKLVRLGERPSGPTAWESSLVFGM